MIRDRPETESADKQETENGKQARQLLILTNKLLRCYRAITGNSDITELSRAEASPFTFKTVSGTPGEANWLAELAFEASPPRAIADATETITERIRALLAAGSEPEVADLLLLDAERAIREGRFREAVLFCWSTIDSMFNRKYERLVDSKLGGEWSDARDFLKGVDFPLRHKMSAALYLVSGRSFFREPGFSWEGLTNSYKKRNAIIHDGDTAEQDDAEKALSVARKVVEIMCAL
jgi:hypothetical protein